MVGGWRYGLGFGVLIWDLSFCFWFDVEVVLFHRMALNLRGDLEGVEDLCFVDLLICLIWFGFS